MNARGLTLLEVIVALALLAGTAGSILVAQSRAARQIQEAAMQRKAAELAEGLLCEWRIAGKPLDQPEEGTFDGHWRWRREVTREQIPIEGDLLCRTEMLHIKVTVTCEPEAHWAIIGSLDWLQPPPEKKGDD